ncbi:DUF1064 domain-containing protein [Paenibacillus polymyxa]|jgi:ABC-type sulfate transport system substrate-binding protein|uniref:DUF1064 domain-containing protein n=1 Tax=Paenibacillus polymyxa TaxID=1406 RepID=UPI0015807ED2|nr:DUF1064 domain-containing protein [Paenibacillus polymyxa]MCF2717847.1 DUF1064 domain-containing protein [Paenibacillus sp. UKAQ_18]MBY0024520.1 DUF1064 domain-containing protein [Paenibacillus polymyxa]MBY0058648.1 DUF1064 domain-containing protein [Paenibacillus polymyxa]MBY0071234.1 DUF1064 domain-containing protein [Paenibacillus polymyxa]MBY0078610.1 DUF1064 domain-containing protein [Paenibacillus polymyxa]
MKTNKYNAKKTIIDGIEFDSKTEAKRYGELKILERGGIISGLTLQPRFTVFEPFTKHGKKRRAITYKADFMYQEDGKTIVEDVKGFAARDFPLRRKLFDGKFPDLILRVITLKKGAWEEI